MPVKILVCKNCQSEFIFNVGEQRFFAALEFPDPVRCPECRRKNSLAKRITRIERCVSRFAALGDVLQKHLGGKV